LDPQQPTLATRQSRVPTDINIGSVLSHMQAKALVQHAQQSILDMEAEEYIEPLSSGLTTLALESRLKRAEEERNGGSAGA
jgi:hypothetical protein